MSNQIDPKQVGIDKSFLRFLLTQMGLVDSLAAAIALEEIATEIRQRMASSGDGQ